MNESILKAKQFFLLTQSEAVTSNIVTNQSVFLFVKTDGKNIMVQHADIVFIEGLKDYILIHLNNQKLVVLENLKDIELKLPTADFKRVHRSFLVRTDKIIAIEGNQIHLKNKTIPIGETYRKDFYDWIEKNK